MGIQVWKENGKRRTSFFKIKIMIKRTALRSNGRVLFFFHFMMKLIHFDFSRLLVWPMQPNLQEEREIKQISRQFSIVIGSIGYLTTKIKTFLNSYHVSLLNSIFICPLLPVDLYILCFFMSKYLSPL